VLVADRERRLSGAVRLAHIDRNRLEGGSKQRPESLIIVYEQQAHFRPPDQSLRVTLLGRVGLIL
jgi:hypothetical protein